MSKLANIVTKTKNRQGFAFISIATCQLDYYLLYILLHLSMLGKANQRFNQSLMQKSFKLTRLSIESIDFFKLSSIGYDCIPRYYNSNPFASKAR